MESEPWSDIVDRELTMGESGRLSPSPTLDHPQTTSHHSSRLSLPPSLPKHKNQSSQERSNGPNPKPLFQKDKTNKSFGANNDNPRYSYNGKKKT